MGSRASSSNSQSFKNFMKGWAVRQDQLLQDLMIAQTNIGRNQYKDEDLKNLVSRALALYQDYYEEKSRAARRITFRMFAPPSSSPFECAYLWITGFKPTSMLHIIFHTFDDLSNDQMNRIQRLADGTRTEERALTKELAMTQESVAAPPVMAAARRVRSELDAGMDGMVESWALENLRSAMEVIINKADLLRTSTASRVVEILTLPQCIKFLAAATRLQKNIRTWTS